jgi:hypothetical protein
MRLRWILLLGAAAGTAALCAALWGSGSKDQEPLEKVRQELRQQGFKIELEEFDFSVPVEMSARASVLRNADLIGPGIQGTDYFRRSVLWQNNPAEMSWAGADAAVVAWKQESLAQYGGKDLWPTLRQVLAERRQDLDEACAAALSGPIGFDLAANHGSAMLLPHLGTLKNVAQTLGARAILELHDGNREAAWTNVLGATRLITAWAPERVEVACRVRCACVAIVCDIIWQALQAGGWSDDQLARLQTEWAGVDFFRGLPDTAAFARASMVATCRLERQDPLPPGVTATQMVQSPRSAWHQIQDRSRQVWYQQQGTYEDERALLLYYRDRELQFRRAVQAPTWSEMRGLPGVTNSVPFQSQHYSRTQYMINRMQIGLAIQGQGVGLLGQAAEAEARRRLIVAAVAVERYRGRHGQYPGTLRELVPELLPQVPADFMDGQPLRYHPTDDGHFVLYSAGLDCVDNGGVALGRKQRGPDAFGIQQGTDLVWPRPASSPEVKAQRDAEARRITLATAEQEKRSEVTRPRR